MREPVRDCIFMKGMRGFERRGVVEGFFGDPWSMTQRRALFELGAARGMNAYLYAPKDDPYHRKFWRRAYPRAAWQGLSQLIRRAHKSRIEFVYGFHPGAGLCFSEERPIGILLEKAQRFYDAGVRTFAVLFDDIPSCLTLRRDRETFNDSLAAAEALWLNRLIAAQPAAWRDIEWWICPSFYSEDPLLADAFGRFEPNFLETMARYLPANVCCFWTGPQVVCDEISLAHVRRVAQTIQRRLLLWDNYPVNDLSMRDELHIGPLQRRDPRLPESVHGYLNNPSVQPELSLIPLATCFDYAAAPNTYDAEKSWTGVIEERFGARTLPHWRAIRRFCDEQRAAKKRRQRFSVAARERARLRAAVAYIQAHRRRRGAREIAPRTKAMQQAVE
jgi:hyaluronoglucosaminidase